jgi:AAA domain
MTGQWPEGQQPPWEQPIQQGQDLPPGAVPNGQPQGGGQQPQPRPDSAELHAELLQVAAMRLVRFGPEGVEDDVQRSLEWFANWPENAAAAYAARVAAEARALSWPDVIGHYRTGREAGHRRPGDESARLAAGKLWRPGIRLRPGTEHLIPDLEAEFGLDVTERARALAVQEAARHELDAQGWSPPDATGRIAAELALPRSGEPHRIPGLAGMGHAVLVAGPRKTGKTQLLVNLAASLSMSGWVQEQPPPAPQKLVPGRFLGWSDCWMGGNVAYLNLEMDPDDWRDVFRALPPGGYGPDGVLYAAAYDPARIFPVHRRGLPLPVVTSKAAREWFAGWLRQHQVEVLIIDTWGALCAKNGVRNLNDDAEARAVTDGLDEIAKAAGVRSVYVSIHMPHQTGEKHLERFKGAGATGDWADTLWTFTADGAGTRYLGALGRARIDMAARALDYDPVTGLLSWGASGTKAQTEAGRMAGRIRAALEQAGRDGMLTEVLLDAAGGHRSDARDAVRKMAADGEITVVPDGRAKRYFLPGMSGGAAS